MMVYERPFNSRRINWLVSRHLKVFLDHQSNDKLRQIDHELHIYRRTMDRMIHSYKTMTGVHRVRYHHLYLGWEDLDHATSHSISISRTTIHRTTRIFSDRVKYANSSNRDLGVSISDPCFILYGIRSSGFSHSVAPSQALVQNSRISIADSLFLTMTDCSLHLKWVEEKDFSKRVWNRVPTKNQCCCA